VQLARRIRKIAGVGDIFVPQDINYAALCRVPDYAE
jgi:hypothetical protein